MRFLNWLGRGVDWLLDKFWVLVCVLTIYGTLTSCAPLTLHSVTTPRVANNIRFLYDNVQVGSGNEFAFCVYGRVVSNNMLITDIDLPIMQSSDSTSVSYFSFPCDAEENMLGIGHSHPPGYVCAFSDQDWNTFRSSRYRYSFLTCENNVLAVYTRRQIPPVELTMLRDSTKVATK